MTAVLPGTKLDKVRVAAVADLHYGRYSPGALQRLFAEVAAAADMLLLGGDLTDYGLVDEARALAREISHTIKIPVIAVLGNHDFESGQAREVGDTFRDAGMIVLDGDTCEVHGIGVAGVGGFCGGFGRHSLGSWGEPAIKAFVQEAVNETLKLETALARLRTNVKLALLHYSPVIDTVIGEPEQIFPFLGSGRLEEPLNRYQVSAVFHGHAHRGQPEGRTSGGAPVYNVSLPLMENLNSERPFRVVEFTP